MVIPAYNEAGRISEVLDRVREITPADVLVVDDGSSDATRLEAQRSGARVATHPVNLGYGLALQTGYRYALRHGYDSVVQLDADGQHDPAHIPELVAGLERADVVVGSRFLNGGTYRAPWARRVGMWVFGTIGGLLSRTRLTDPTSGYQAVSRDAMAFYAHDRYPSDYPDADTLAMVSRSGLRVLELPVRMLPSPAGKSMHAGIVRSVYYALRMSIALALVPLRNEKR